MADPEDNEKAASSQESATSTKRSSSEADTPVNTKKHRPKDESPDEQIAQTPRPPYYAVIFTSLRNTTTTTSETEAYGKTAQRMVELARQQPGYLGVESARDGLGITVSYWKDLPSIRHWKQNCEHVQAQENGIQKWYSAYTTRIALVERDYSM
ncbi:Antibiotic biosynthesis monooxygenase [Seminavis robusta]|uniref:Antibiotic biosynthesis monooxygenase n=1 Tax=Seminavis robusta TaxID=568900 RepID=A0A9N8DWL4_9STRA|nr:Antibiotic biosynthesis monooxygenase [Seminavis robusta]|eukprot:Sro327_g118440.1 Antibiotic biosynthesis monooxygenase (154) ;mRNA; r:59865-60326